MRSIRSLRGGAVAGALCWLLVLSFAAPVGADPSSVSDLRQQNASLAAQSHSSLVELYSLESRLREQHARVDSLRAQVDAVSAERASVRYRLTLVRRVLRISRRNLERRLVHIYEQGRPDALAILLGAESLGDAITNLDHQSALAGQDKRMLDRKSVV